MGGAGIVPEQSPGGKPAPPASAERIVAQYRRKDAAYLAAQRAGYRSRAAIKLLELDRRFRIFRRGAVVLDLGAWPGSWLQVASDRVGSEGRVVGVDLKAIEPLGRANVHTVVGDIGQDSVAEAVVAALGGRADVVLSDMAPKLSGVKAADTAREQALADLGRRAARRWLAEEGKLVIKLFSAIETEVARDLEREFSDVSRHRPDSSRKGSSELYAVAWRRRG